MTESSDWGGECPGDNWHATLLSKPAYQKPGNEISNKYSHCRSPNFSFGAIIFARNHAARAK